MKRCFENPLICFVTNVVEGFGFTIGAGIALALTLVGMYLLTDR